MGDKVEREQELEALEAIFGDELERLSDDAFEISITTQSGRTIGLRVSTPEGYPSRAPPLFEIEAAWLSQDEERFMVDQLQGMFAKGEVIVYIWAEWIREFVMEPGVEVVMEEKAKLGETEEEGGEEGDLVEEEFLDDMLENTLVLDEGDEGWSKRVISGETSVDRKSIFQAHMAVVRSPEEVDAMRRYLLSNNKIKRATHNIVAYRVHTSAGAVSGDCDDDGEDAAGGRLLHLLSILDARDICIVVSRWYGGIKLGPDRFKHINNSARNLMMLHPAMWAIPGGEAGKGGKKGKGR